jgi:hypothetical protein
MRVGIMELRQAMSAHCFRMALAHGSLRAVPIGRAIPGQEIPSPRL